MASFAAAILEARLFKLGNEFSNSQRQWRLLGCLLNSLARSGAGRDDEKIRLRPEYLATDAVSSNAQFSGGVLPHEARRVCIMK
jgi:hypothetical protein